MLNLPQEPMNIDFLVQEFYAIEAVNVILEDRTHSKFDPFRHSHSRWYRDFNDFRSEYISKLASAIFDYTVLVVAGELRHCYHRASHYIVGYYTNEAGRKLVYYDCSAYDPIDILMAGIKMFDTDLVKWDEGYGGDKWKQIATAGLLKSKVEDCVFIDHCVDLSHNNCTYFDKGAEIFYILNVDKYQEFLNKKFTCRPQELFADTKGIRFNRLLQRAYTLDVIEAQPFLNNIHAIKDKAESLLLDYKPIEWDNARLNFSDSKIVCREDYKRKTRRRDTGEQVVKLHQYQIAA